jgi:valyl-tRNA synthetase
MPFLSEELYQRLPMCSGASINTAPYPKFEEVGMVILW